MQPTIRFSLRTSALRSLLGCLTLLTSSLALAANQPPKISGAPRTSVTVNWWYSWAPIVSDPDNAVRTLRFSIANKPSWALFSVYSGKLEGKPTRAGEWSNIRITVTDGRASATLPAFTVRAVTSGGSTGGGSVNVAPTISGSPSKAVTPGVPYSFTPTARDSNGDALTFSISNRPSWASFSAATGRLSGTPASAHVGAYSNIRIAVADGRGGAASLPAFAVTVTEVANGSATLSWTPPTRNTNGTSLTNLAGYRIYYGTNAGALNQTVQIANPGLAAYVVSNLTPATWYFAVRAYNNSGSESMLSNLASKTIR